MGRITVINRDFFFSSQVHSVDIQDISNVFTNTRLFFAQLEIVSKTFKDNVVRIENLRKIVTNFTRSRLKKGALIPFPPTHIQGLALLFS